MRARRESLFHLIEPLLGSVEHPARYLDHEWGSCQEQDGPFHLAMVYADVYEVGQPNLGVAILYNQVNAQEGMSCERCYLPWKDMAAALKRIGYQGAIVMEPFVLMGGSIAYDIKVWRDLVPGADEAALDKLAGDACRFLKDLTA